MNAKKRLPLSAAQMEIMEIIWDHSGQLEWSVTEVQQHLGALGRDLARNTVQTMMLRMEEKGWLKHRAAGRTFLYAATCAKEVSLGNEVKRLLDDSFQGSVEGLVNSLLQTTKLRKGEASRIRKLIDDAEKKRRK